MKKVFFIIITASLFVGCSNSMQKIDSSTKYDKIRLPQADGQFYPAEADRLKKKILKYLEDAPEKNSVDIVKTLIVPHAGYDFSGSVAAQGYKLLQGQKVNTVVIICNSHSSFFDGVVIDDSDAWQTPLGLVEIDNDLSGKLVDYDEKIKFDSKPYYTSDQTIEVQIPFLQTVLGKGFKIVPILFGNAHDDTYKILAKALQKNLGGNDIVIVSSDMSHYPNYKDANKIDKKTLEIIAGGDVKKLELYEREIMRQDIDNEQTVLCGIDGIKTVLELYGLENNKKIEVLKYMNSGDTLLGSKREVVGYGAVAFWGEAGENYEIKKEIEDSTKNVLNERQKKELLKIARETVEFYVRKGDVPKFEVNDERLLWKEGAFVTIHKNGQLRGCIGQIEVLLKPLWKTVRDMAQAACSEDHRFSPVVEDELASLNYEVSVLSKPEKIDNWQEIELGKHGVIIRRGFRSGVFLPQVAEETGWSREEFLEQLCWQKAGLDKDCYKDSDTNIEVFTAQVFGNK